MYMYIYIYIYLYLYRYNIFLATPPDAARASSFAWGAGALLPLHPPSMNLESLRSAM